MQHDSAYADNKDLINRTKSDNVLRDKAYNIASNPEYDGYQRGLASMLYEFFDKKSMGKGTVKSTAKSTAKPSSLERSSLKLADELHKPIIKKFNKRKVYSQFKDNMWGVDLADMQSLSKKNKGIKYLLCAIDLYSKYAFVIPLKDKKGISIANAFDKIIKQANRKPNKIWVDQGSEFYNRDFKKWLSSNDIIMYSTTVICKHMTATGKNVYYDVLDDIVSKFNNTKHNTIKMKPKDVKNDNNRVYIDEHNKKSARYNVGDRVRISKFKVYLLKDILLIGVEKYLLLIK